MLFGDMGRDPNCGIVTTITSASLIQSLSITTYGSALTFGAIVGVGYLVSTTVNVAINPNIQRLLVYGVVSGSYFLVSSLVVSVILVAMRLCSDMIETTMKKKTDCRFRSGIEPHLRIGWIG